MFLSVIIPIYNSEPYLRRCIDSVIAQNMGDELELILIDDGSTDASGTICDQYSLKYDWIHTYHICNSGVSNARNYGIKHIKGDYFTFIDSDDFIDSGFYKEVIKIHKQKPSDLYVFGYKDYPVRNDGLHVLKQRFCADNESLAHLYLEMKQNYLMFPVINKIFKSTDDNIFFITNIHYFEDYLFSLEYLKNVKTVNVINRAAYNYVHHSGEHLGKKYTEPEVVVEIAREIKRYSEILPQSDSLTKYIVLEYYNNLLHAIDCCQSITQKIKYINIFLCEIQQLGYKEEFKKFLGRRKVLLLFPNVLGLLIMLYLRMLFLKLR